MLNKRKKRDEEKFLKSNVLLKNIFDLMTKRIKKKDRIQR